MSTSEEPGLPWYRYFWTWFIVILLGISIAGSLWTVSIAYGLGDLEAGIDHPGALRAGAENPAPAPARAR